MKICVLWFHFFTNFFNKKAKRKNQTPVEPNPPSPPLFQFYLCKFRNFYKLRTVASLNNQLSNTITSFDNVFFIGKIEKDNTNIPAIIRINRSIVNHYAIFFLQCQNDQRP